MAEGDRRRLGPSDPRGRSRAEFGKSASTAAIGGRFLTMATFSDCNRLSRGAAQGGALFPCVARDDRIVAALEILIALRRSDEERF
jgi:hypothetical protein